MVATNFGNTEIPLNIDTGTNSFATLHPKAVEKLQAEATAVSEMGASIHNSVDSRIVRVDSITIAGHQFKSQLADLGAFNSLGFGALMNSDFILSMPDKSLYMSAPNEPVGRGELDKSGLRLLTHKGSIVVFQASEDGPAFATGLRNKDVVTKFNGELVSGKDIWNVRNRLSGQPGDEIKIEFKRGGEESLVNFVLGPDPVP